MCLVMAAKVDPADRDYYETVIAPMVRDSPFAEYIGEVNDHEKDELLGGGLCLSLPHRLAGTVWPNDGGVNGHGHAGYCDAERLGAGAYRGRGYRIHMR